VSGKAKGCFVEVEKEYLDLLNRSRTDPEFGHGVALARTDLGFQLGRQQRRARSLADRDSRSDAQKA
jgi:hypothetical protein